MKIPLKHTPSLPRAIAGLIVFVIAGSCGAPLYKPGVAVSIAEVPLPAQDRTDFFRVEDDIYLYRFTEGAGSAVLFLHGGPGIPPAQSPAGLRKVPGLQITYPHERGSGRSTRPIQRFTSSNYYANMKELDRRLGLSVHLADIERMRRLMKQDRLTLIGHSFGGFLAALYAAEFPEHVDRLVLIAPAGVIRMPSEDGGLFTQVRKHLPADEQPAYDGFMKRYLDYRTIFEKDDESLAALHQEFSHYYGRAATAAGMPGLPSGTLPTSPNPWMGGWVVHGLYVSLGRENDLRPMLEKVQARTIIIHGAKDLSPPESSVDYQRIPNHRKVIMPASGHFPFTDHPEDFARIVQEFLAEP